MTSALVIDDNRQAADGVCQIVSLLGLQARSAYGAREAMLTLRDNIPDIIFLDIQLPGVDGFEVLSFLRREPRLKDIPVVMVTSDDQPETALKAHQTGALLTLIKPVSVETLERVLRTAKLIK
jgi:chemosensory pili system protein ChpA (sensor histidine kinase/response regulator)